MFSLCWARSLSKTLQRRNFVRQNSSLTSQFEPPSPTNDNVLNRYHHALILSEFLRQHSPNIVVIGGAGFSTESGQPDYRSPFGAYSKGHKPITCQEFLSSETDFYRRRYWLRSFMGFSRMWNLNPNAAHFAVASWETEKLISHIITQNVDRLHSKAGSQKILELHGNLFEVGCVSCNFSTPRPEFQERVLELNPSLGSSYSDPTAQTIRPDGDVAVLPMKVEDFEIPPCLKCGGILKPKVVFFGESIPRKIVDESYSLIDRASALICIGTSLQVHSAFRLVKRAKERNLPIAVVNLGPTRADEIVQIRIEDQLGALLPLLPLETTS